jgi:hypothetical protein
MRVERGEPCDFTMRIKDGRETDGTAVHYLQITDRDATSAIRIRCRSIKRAIAIADSIMGESCDRFEFITTGKGS